MTLATVTGTIYRNTGPDTARVPWAGGRVVAVPILLDETTGIADSKGRVIAITDAAGLVTLHLWPGAWRITIPDGEVIDGADHAGVVVTDGQVTTLDALRGYVAPPGVSVTVIEVPTGLADDVAEALGAADAAALSAAGASAAADAAAASESAALASQGAAGGSAQAAAASALGAAGSADAAAGHAATASSQASTASGSAADAEVARDAAVTAQGLAEDARDAAALSATAADGSADAADVARLAAESARDATAALDLSASATTLAAGASATATVSGTLPDLTLALGIPQGAPGPASTISIGTVTKIASGGTPTASIAGAAPTQTLNLGLVTGDPGSPTAYELRGAGMPNGVVTASPGTYYTDTAGTNGAWRWLKKSGTGNTGWEVVIGDTGWRDVTASLLSAPTVSSGKLLIRRIGDVVNLRFMALAFASDYTMAVAHIYLLPLGFKVEPQPFGFVRTNGLGIRGSGATAASTVYLMRRDDIVSTTWGAGWPLSGSIVALTTDLAWPTALPGTPA